MTFFFSILVFFLASLSTKADNIDSVTQYGSKRDSRYSGAFFEIIEKNGGKMPGSFLDFVNLMNGKDSVLAIPDGRSLQRKKADFKDPRFVVATKDSSLFIGYAPKANQVEVISWNNEKGKFDFFVIENYADGLRPKLTRPIKSTCLTCHQSEAPIFSRGGWNESTISPPFTGSDGVFYEASPMYAKLVQSNGGSRIIQGFDIDHITVTTPSFYDALVRDANKKQQVVKACRATCHDRRCRTQLALASFNAFDPTEIENLRKMLEQSWPRDGFEYPSSVIPNRDPLQESEQGGMATSIYVKDIEGVKKFLRTPNTVEVEFRDENGKLAKRTETNLPYGDPDSQSSTAATTEKSLENAIKTEHGYDVTFDEKTSPIGNGFPVNFPYTRHLVEPIDYPALPGSPADPLFRRPKVNAIAKNEALDFMLTEAALCFGFTRGDQEILRSNHSYRSIQAAIKQSEMQALLDHWPVDRIHFMKTMLTILGAKSLPTEYQSAKNAKSTLKVALEREHERKISMKTKNLFIKYCAHCHSTNEIAKIDFDDITKLKSHGATEDKTVLQMLESKRMPPPGYPKPSEKERLKMIKILNE